MTRLEIVLTSVTWATTAVNYWIYRRYTREKKQYRKRMLRYRSTEVLALMTRLDEIARGLP
jgi:hypothetical protein